MRFLQNFPNVLGILSLLTGPTSSLNTVSLWGKMADFSSTCNHWRLRPDVSIPALRELTVCLHLQFEVLPSSQWTAFMYSPAKGQWAELGLGGRWSQIEVWLFGFKWTSLPIHLYLRQWHALCMTWSETTYKPTLYVNGSTVDLTPANEGHSPPTSCSHCRLAPGGTLTLGVAHVVVNGKLQIERFSRLRGRVSLFRLWGQARAKQEVMSQYCTEGELVRWQESDWETKICSLASDPALQCDWSIYEVVFVFRILRFDGKDMDKNIAGDLAHVWLKEMLPNNIRLYRVSVSERNRSADGSLGPTPHDERLVKWVKPDVDQFDCLIHINVIPSRDVATVQKEVYEILQIPHEKPDLLLRVDPSTLYITPIESFTRVTMAPPATVTESPVATTPTFKSTTSPSTESQTTTSKPSHIMKTTRAAGTSSSTITASTIPANTITASTTTASTTTASTIIASTTTASTIIASTIPANTITASTTTASATTASTTTASATTASTTTASTIIASTIPASTTTSMIPASTTTASTILASTSTASTITASTSTASTSTASTTTLSTITESTITATISTAASGNISEMYFEVRLNVTLTADCDPELPLFIWLNTCLPHEEMMVLNFQLLAKETRSNSSLCVEVPLRRRSRESCVFQVQVMRSSSDTEATEQRIRYLLELPYDTGSVTVQTEDLHISRILIVQCPAHVQQTRKGLFKWPDTQAQNNATQQCPGNPLHYATRHCKLCLSTHWMDPDLDQCPLVVETIPHLDHIEVTPENGMDVVVIIESLLRGHSTLNFQELATILNKLMAIVSLSTVTPKLGGAVINIISDILESDSNLLPFTNTILNITEVVGDRMWGYEGSTTLVASAMAIAVVDVTPGHLGNLTFAVSSVQGSFYPKIYINEDPFNGIVAFISLPPALQQSFPQHSERTPRVQFQFYGIPKLFKGSPDRQILNTFVVSASVANASSPIKDLDDSVRVTVHHLIPNTLNKDVQCVYWNFNKNDGQGGWDSFGCQRHHTDAHYTTCLCDHLTHFGVLMDITRTQVDVANEQALTLITHLGCGVSSLFLGVTVLTYTAFEKLRRDYPSQILLNLSLALLGLNMVFLINSWLSSWGLYGLCIAVASTLHYFLLASFTWMGLEAVNMYFALVKVFNHYVPAYILKICAVGWGVPLLICALVLIVNREAYGSHLYTDGQPSRQPLGNTDDFCWLQDDTVFYLSVVGYAIVIFLINIAVFVVVLLQIRRMRVNRPAGSHSGLLHDLKGVASLTLLLGLTWTVGLFTWGPSRIPLLYLFSGLNSLQGAFIFLFHCLMRENVRKQWRTHLCFGRFRVEEHFEWSHSHTASVGAVVKSRPNPPLPLVPSIRSVKSSTTESTAASCDSSQETQPGSFNIL